MQKEEKKFVDSEIMEGMTSISALIKGIQSGTNHRKIIKVFIDRLKKKNKYAEIRFLSAKAQEMGFEIEFTDADTIDGMTVGSTHGGIIAECTPRTLPKLTSKNIAEKGLYFILDGIEDPYNFGYAVRSLYASGVNGLILGERNWLGTSGVVAKASAGCSELMDIYVSESLDAIRLLKDKNYKIVSAGIRDSVSLFDADLSLPLCVILGGEKRGISRSVLEQSDQVLRIDYGNPFGGSLSAAATAAVFGFEILRYNRT